MIPRESLFSYVLELIPRERTLDNPIVVIACGPYGVHNGPRSDGKSSSSYLVHTFCKGGKREESFHKLFGTYQSVWTVRGTNLC